MALQPQFQQIKHQPSPYAQANLTDWKNEPNILVLKQDLEMAKPAHDALVRNIERWSDLAAVRGTAKPPKVKGRSQVQPKLIRRQAEWRYSALTEPFLGSEKLYKVQPRTFEDVKAAEQNEILLNYQFDTKINKVKFIDDYVRCTVDEGSCVLRVGWKRNTIKVKQTVPTYNHELIDDAQQAETFQQIIVAREQDPNGFATQAPPELKAALDYYDETGQATVAKENGTTTVEVEKVLENKPTVDVLNLKNVFVDPTCQGDIDKALFTIVSFETSKAELLKEPNRYKNLERVNWETATPATESEHAQSNASDINSTNFQDILRKRVVAYEYWGWYDIDKTGTLKPFVATWIGDTMIRMELNPFPDEKLPFLIVTYLPVKRELFGEPDAELLEDNQKIIGAVTRGMLDLMGRSANSQQGFAKGMLDPLNRRRYERGEDYEYNPNQNPEQGLITHKYPELSNSAVEMVTLQNNEAEALTGVKSFAGGISGQAYGDVAAGIRGVLDAASKREMGILRRLAKGIRDLGDKFSSMNAVFLSKEEVVRVTNNQFVTVNREDLKGNFDLKVDISTAEVDDMQAKDLAFMLQTIGPDEDPGMRKLILAKIARLKRMPDLAKMIENYQPPVDPIAEKMKELALEKVQMEVEELRSKAQLNQAKAQEANANTDKTNLDYVEQETGTTHARNMQQDQAQAQGNQQLEITKALLRPKKPEESKPDVPAAIGWNELSARLNGKSPSSELERGAPPVDSTIDRDELVDQGDPRYSIGSRFYDPNADPSSNPNLNIGV